MRANETAAVVLLLALAAACDDSSGSPGSDAAVNSARATRSGTAPVALPSVDGPPGVGGAGGPGGGGGSSQGAGGSAGGAGAGGNAAGAGGSAADAPAPPVDLAAADLPASDVVPAACEQGGACERLNKEYAAALLRAQVCVPNGTAQCMATAPQTLDCADCSVWVNDTKELTPLQAEARAAGCDRCLVRCPERPCRALRRGACQPTGGILLPSSHACGEATLLLP